jgi:hypothetical protein
MLTFAAILYYKKLEDKINPKEDFKNNFESIGTGDNKKALNRWHVVVTLINNPQLVKFRNSLSPKLKE